MIGDIPEGDGLRELAEEGLRLERGKELAREAATLDRDTIIGGAALTEVFDSPGALGLDVALGDELPIEDQGDAARKRPKAEMIETGPFGKGAKNCMTSWPRRSGSPRPFRGIV